MSPIVPSLEEIAETVERLEERFQASDEQNARALMRAYRQTALLFGADLSDPRDVALSKGGALMLMKALLETA